MINLSYANPLRSNTLLKYVNLKVLERKILFLSLSEHILKCKLKSTEPIIYFNAINFDHP